jgi:amino acid adenylation domain-containing protein
MDVLDARGLEDASLAAAVEDHAYRPFDLEHGPIFRATLFVRHGGAVLLLSVHHIAADFWSLETMAGELRHLYEACATGRPGALLPAASSYEAYVAWQSAYLESEKGAEDIRYWSNELSGAPTILAIPTDKPRPASPSSRGRSAPFVVPADVAAGLRALADREGVTVFTVLLAAYQVLLSRYSMQDDVLVGTPVAGRSRKVFAPLVGYFVNSVVLRGRLGENPAFAGYLQQTRRAVTAALDRQDAPFPLIVERLKPHRDPGRSPFFQAMFSLQQARDERASALAGIALGVPGGSLAWDGLTLEGYPLQRRVAQFDLSLEMASAGSTLLGSLEYAEDLFHAETAARMVEQFNVLLAGIVTNPAARVKSLSLVSPDEARLQLDEWNRTERPYGPAETVIDLWLKQVAERPDAIALVDGEVQVTYRDLSARAGVIARRLSAAGVGLDSKVVILLPRSADMIAAVLGVLTAGAAYVPIDPGTPARRISLIVENCGAAAIVTSTLLRNRLPGVGCAVYEIDAYGSEPATANAPAVRAAGRENAAYVIYTSGTSGHPKGVVVEHRNLLHYVQAAAEAFAIRQGDRVLQFASLAFDASVEEIFTTLAAGGTLVLRDDGMLESAATFLARCGDLDITVLDLPTAYWNELVASAARENWQQAEALRLVILGGERVTVERLERWQDTVGPRVELLNTYGPTEATVAATVANLTHVEPADLAEMTEVSIGRPFPNCRAYVLDDELEPLPIGAPGELCLGGEGIAAGYLDAPELTASRFLADPFVSTPGARIYRTGDKARFLADGSLQYLGRLDQQVKIRGHRVELGEIEAALEQQPGVRHAAVSLDGMEAGDRRLIGYVETDPGTPLSAAGLRAFLKERLPQYMVPSIFVAVAAMPMSAAGKIDRRQLPAPSAANTLRDESSVPEGNALEARMAAVWKRVLKIDHVGVHENFFDVGGHSLLLPVLLNEIRKEFDRTVTMVALLERPTIAASAALFGELDRTEDHAVQRGRARASRMREMTARQRRTASSKDHHDSLSA